MKETKLCTKCNRELPLENFNKKTTSPDGLQYICKECKSEYNKQNYRRNKNGVTSGELSQFTPRQLIDELKARRYKGTLIYEQKINL